MLSFLALICGTIELSQHEKMGVFKYLVARVERREVELLIYANILESETHLISLEIRITNQQN